MAIGYACLLMDVPGTGLSRCSLKNASNDNLTRITMANLDALGAMIDYNIQNNIKLFRISSDIIPFGSHPVNQIRWWEEYQDRLKQLGQKITDAGIRVSMHPGQYTIINSPDSKVVQNSMKDLEYQERFLTSLGMDEKSKLVLHIGGVYGDKEEASKAFRKNYYLLAENIKKRLVIENDDRNYNIEDVLRISEVTGAPVVFDNLHHSINQPKAALLDRDWILHCGSTWRKQDGTQKIHYSQQKVGGKPGSHSDTIVLTEFINYYNELPDKELDIMLEVKDKNLSALNCIKAVENKMI